MVSSSKPISLSYEYSFHIFSIVLSATKPFNVTPSKQTLSQSTVHTQHNTIEENYLNSSKEHAIVLSMIIIIIFDRDYINMV